MPQHPPQRQPHEHAASRAKVPAWLDALYTQAEDAALTALSQAVRQVADSLGLDTVLLDCASLAPFLRADAVSLNFVEKHAGKKTAVHCRELVTLLDFSLPGQWLPGEQLPEAHSEGLRRMLLAVVNDYRLVIVRLALQLCDLRAARDATVAEQQMLARDTREIFAPLANRLGIWQLKWELEDFAFRFLQPADYKTIARQLDERRDERERYIADARDELLTLLGDAGLEASVSGRPKHIFSIYRKLQRKNVSVDDLFDIRAVRIIVNTVTECYTALGVVHNRWPYIREEFDDYIANPKGNNYQSLHTAVFGPEGRPLEIQIRTQDMHAQAELGVAAHWRYKEGGASSSAFEQKIAWLRQLLEGSDAGSADMLDSLSDGVFSDRVYAITPRGDIIDLPAGATPLDFAYQVHTQIGHRCRGAKANGRIVNLTYPIRNGDRIEIITAKEPNPSRDWLSPRSGFLASARSRTKVRSWFRQQDKEINRKQGRDHLERELQRMNIRDLPIAKLAAHMGYDDVDGLCIALGVGEITSAAVFHAAQKLISPADQDQPRQKRSRKHKPSGRGAVLVDGTDSVMTHFARCCNPVPPESIQGYITQGRGISVHTQRCSSLQRLASKAPERLIEVAWRNDKEARYPVSIRIEASDRNGLLKDLSGVLNDENVRILGNSSKVNRKSLRAIVQLDTEVDGLDSLSRALTKLSQVPGVVRVERQS
ncbi:MAG: bifunctional (p)ppGpp synthetase/guanosine-3',5'-bis(diphosphate) 3'-pyrophosphohydrolase [Pseudomonadota bacterium]